MINLTISSLNNKSITAIDVTNNIILANFNQSEQIPLNYTNILVKIQTADTLSISNLGHAVNQMSNDWIFFFIAFLLVACAIVTAWLFKRK